MAKEPDPMDQYSLPIRIEDKKLARIFFMKDREVPEKPGRALNVSFDSRFPLIENFVPRYVYWVQIAKAGNYAGNHYHKDKSELFYPVIGKFTVCLEDPSNHTQETVILNSKEHPVLYIKAGVAHKVVSELDDSILLVAATAPGIARDEFPYDVKIKNEN